MLEVNPLKRVTPSQLYNLMKYNPFNNSTQYNNNNALDSQS